jgi:PAS domain S-box-containing protein
LDPQARTDRGPGWIDQRLSALSSLQGPRRYLPGLVILVAGMGFHALALAFAPQALEATFFIYILAILAGAWCGYGPGLLVTALVLTVLPFLFRPGFRLVDINLVGLACFSVVSLVVSRTARAQRRAEAELRDLAVSLERRVHEKTAELEQLLDREHTARTELETRRSELERAEALERRLSSIVESSEDAIVGKTLDGRITSWNNGAARMYGYTADEAIGRSVSMLCPPGISDEVPLLLARLRSGERIGSYETTRLTKDGALIDVSVTLSPILDATGAVVGASAVARDVTARRRAEEERAQLLSREKAARAEADEANRLKNEFLATISHELRGPLQGIVGFTPLLLSRALDADQTSAALKAIDRNARNLTTLIEEILDVSRIITGKMTIEVCSMDLKLVAEAAVQIVRPSAEARNIALATDFDPDVGLIRGDPNRLQQAIWNLLSNAVKFTASGGSVRLKIARETNRIRIEVRDTGVGIAPEFLPYVFERFRQAESPTTRMHGGLGLGLSIVRHIVEAHGGRVTAESDGVGQGATFHLDLPVTAVAADVGPRWTPTEINRDPREPSDALRGVTVLLLDDQADSRATLSFVLQREGATVYTADSVAHALETLERASPHVLLSDIAMPGEDGLGLIRKIRGLPNGASLPAIAVTGFASEADRARSFAAGFQVHLSKPVDPFRLVNSVAELAGRSGVPRSI